MSVNSSAKLLTSNSSLMRGLKGAAIFFSANLSQFSTYQNEEGENMLRAVTTFVTAHQSADPEILRFPMRGSY